MVNFTWSEVFTSIEGEGPYSGHPTIYVRFAKCNFQCKRFNNPLNLEITNDVLGFDPSNYNTLGELPPIAIGCDSIYSWDSRFKHMWETGSEDNLAQTVIDKLPYNKWKHPGSGLPIILSLTGGEPTLYKKKIPILLNHPLFKNLQHILIETNCAVPLDDPFISELSKWILNGCDRKVTWSNSPKLSNSGEDWKNAIQPEIAKQQISLRYMIRVPGYVSQYFKFVCDETDQMFDEVDQAMNEYYAAGIPRNTPIYIMPMACTEEQQFSVAAKVAQQCIDRGYIYCHRLQNSIWGNTIGT